MMPKTLCSKCKQMVAVGRFCSNCAATLHDEQPPARLSDSETDDTPLRTAVSELWHDLSFKAKAWIVGIACFLLLYTVIINNASLPDSRSGNLSSNINPTQSTPAATPLLTNSNAIPSSKPIPKPDPARLREQLRNDYKDTIANANPYLNFIKGQITKDKKGFSLWAVHSLFSQSSFDMGDDVKVVGIWIQGHRQDLLDANIVRVGFKNESGYLGSVWLEVK